MLGLLYLIGAGLTAAGLVSKGTERRLILDNPLLALFIGAIWPLFFIFIFQTKGVREITWKGKAIWQPIDKS